jgi:SAM-dependent methyltransferase
LGNDPQIRLQQKEAEIAFFDRHTRDGDYDVFAERGYERILRAFDANLQPLIRSRGGVLQAVDLGCGTGAFAARLLRYDLKLHGVDISPESVARARRKFPKIDFHVGDIEATPFDSCTFDVVFLSGVLHHFPDLTRTVAECGRILKPGGIVLAYDPHRGNPVMWAYRCKDSPFYSSKGVTENEQPLSKAALRLAFDVEPFEEVRVSAVSGVTYKYVAGRVASLLLPAYNLLERCFDLPLIRQRFGSFVITYARKRQ